MIAHRNGIVANQLFKWRMLYNEGSLSAASSDEEMVPATELAAEQKQICELLHLRGKKTMGQKFSRSLRGMPSQKNELYARPCCHRPTTESSLHGAGRGALEPASTLEPAG